MKQAIDLQEVPLDVRIKWPNDIYANSMKIGGILCQSVYREGAFHVIIGAGLNVNNSKPTTCLASLISDLGRQEGPGIDVSREVGIVSTGSLSNRRPL